MWAAKFYTTSHPNQALNCEKPKIMIQRASGEAWALQPCSAGQGLVYHYSANVDTDVIPNSCLGCCSYSFVSLKCKNSSDQLN